MAMVNAPVRVEMDAPPPSPHRGRAWLLRALTILVLSGLGGRLWFLQVVRYGEAERLAARNRVRLEPTVAPRGAVFDRNGKLLATNRLGHRVSILDLAHAAGAPRARHLFMLGGKPVTAGAEELADLDLPDPTAAEQLARLKPLLGLSAEEVTAVTAELVDPQRPKFAPVTVREDVDTAALTRVEERLWQLPSVLIESMPVRTYPEGPVAAHFVGYVGSISPKELDKARDAESAEVDKLTAALDEARRTWPSSRLAELQALSERLQVAERLRNQTARVVGKTGLEASHDDDLRGEPGMQTWQVNARNQPLKMLRSTEGQAGHSLWLNLDLRLQRLAMQGLAGRCGSVVAIDPRDGGVLAMASSPSYNPNDFIPKIGTEQWGVYRDDPNHPLENRALRAAYPPGSTFKGIVSTAAGLKSGAITANTSVFCSGGMNIGGHVKKCWMVHGGVDLTTAIAMSCDVFFYTAALRMGPEPLLEMAKEFGMGEKTGIDLPDERGGNRPDLEDHRRRWNRAWYSGDTANVVIGQGDLDATTLQMANVTATAANGGTVWRPQLVREVRTRDGKEVVRAWQPQVNGKIDLDEDGWRLIRRGMRAAVTNGTAKPVDMPNVAVAGKTGSAETGNNQEAHAWFVCFAPLEKPTIAICVMVEHGGHGSEAAAPIARQMLDLWFGTEGTAP